MATSSSSGSSDEKGSHGKVNKLKNGKKHGTRVTGGPFPPKEHFPEHEQEEEPKKVPTAKQFHPIVKLSSEGKVLNVADNGTANDPVVFDKYNPSGVTNSKQLTDAADISGADSPQNVVLLTGNWYCDYSIDGGVTFKRVNPTSVFNVVLAKGFCCDQIVIYVPSVDLFVWYMQHNADSNGGAFRLAIASPKDIISDFQHAWTYYDFVSGDFLQGTNDMDYPDMSYSDTFLFMNTDVVGAGGRLVTRIPLKDLAGKKTINFQFTDPTKSTTAWGAHMVQGSLDGGFWLGHKNNTTLELFSLPDSGNTYSSRFITVATWPNGNLSSAGPGPNSNDWLNKENNFPRFSVTGACRLGNKIWAAWTASSGQGGAKGFNFPNVHVRVAEIDIDANKIASEIQIWNSDYAFAYPALESNSRREIGIILGWGGSKNNANAAVGIIGDFEVWYRDGSTFTTTRWGDYVTVRPSLNPNKEGLFAGFGYNTTADPTNAAGAFYNPYYVLFGRQSLVIPPIK